MGRFDVALGETDSQADGKGRNRRCDSTSVSKSGSHADRLTGICYCGTEKSFISTKSAVLCLLSAGVFYPAVSSLPPRPKDAMRALKKRLCGNKNYREVMLALTVRASGFHIDVNWTTPDLFLVILFCCICYPLLSWLFLRSSCWNPWVESILTEIFYWTLAACHTQTFLLSSFIYQASISVYSFLALSLWRYWKHVWKTVVTGFMSKWPTETSSMVCWSKSSPPKATLQPSSKTKCCHSYRY